MPINFKTSKVKRHDSPAESPGVWLLTLLTGIVLYLCWIMVAPFLSSITWAFALCVVANPVRRRLISKWPKTAVALVILVAVVAIIALSLYLMSQRLIQEAVRARQLFEGFVQPAAWQRLIESNGWMGSVWSWAHSQFDLEAIAKEASATVARSLAPAFGKSAMGLSRAFLSLLFFFFFVRDQETLIEGARRLLPLTPSESEKLFERTTATVQGTVIGRIGIGAIQGAIGGILFLLLGIPAPLFWSIVMALFSMVPAFGAFVVWIPASVILLASGHWIRALILVAGGVALIHPVDNILYPLLVGPWVGLHPIVLLIAFLGGVIVFGPPGLILGPIIVTIAMALVEIWHARTSEKLQGGMPNEVCVHRFCQDDKSTLS
jgi:predicted PurR-regulated permease PerM